MKASVLACVLIQVTNGLFLNGMNGGPMAGPMGGPGGPGGFSVGSDGCVSLHHYCPLSMAQCSNGFAKDAHGCPLCHCADPSTDPSRIPVHHTIQNPCIPTQARCGLTCDTFMKGGSGCEFCMCDNSHKTQAPVSTEKTTVKTATTTQAPPAVTSASAGNATVSAHNCDLATQICNAQCNGDYLVDPNDCTFCVCKSDLG